jgi:putative transposase
VPVPLSAEDHIELLPAIWRAVNAYGIKISHRTYDAEELNPVRQQKSGVTARKGLWEVRHDPLSRLCDNGSYADLGVIPSTCHPPC